MFTAAKTGLFGIDLGATSVKAAQIVRKDNAWFLRDAAIVPRRDNWTVQELSDKEAKPSADEIAAVASLCESLAAPDAAALMPMSLCDLLQIEAPVSKRHGGQEIVRAVETETRRSAADRVMDFWPVDAQSRKLNVVTAPRLWSDQISAEVAGAGKNCRLVDVLPLALTRAASLVDTGRDGRIVAALDWGYTKATLVLIREQSPVLIRCLKDSGFHRALTTLAETLRLDLSDAELLVVRHGAAEIDGTTSTVGGLLREVMAEHVAGLVREIQRTLNYWQGVARLSPETIFLFGGGGTLAGVDQHLTEALGIHVRRWEIPFENDSNSAPPPCMLGAAVGMSAAAWDE